MVIKFAKQLVFLAAAFTPTLLAQSALTITTPNALPIATVNQAYAVQLAATGGTTPYLWHFQSGGNPSARFSISGSGQISGTPSSADLGSVTMSVQVTDANSVTVTKQFTFTVQSTQPLTLTTKTFTPGVVGIPYSLQLQATGGTQPYKWDVLPAIVTFPVPGQVAAGLTLDSTTGLVTGTPTQSGTFSFTITLTDYANGSVSVPFSLTVSAGGPLGITTASLPGGTVGAPYSQTLDANGGVPPYQWAVTTGSLPGGLSLDGLTGIISGSPTAAATTPFTVTVTDRAATPGTARQALTLSVVAPAALNITTITLPGGTQGAPYSQKIAITGGVLPYHWSLSAGTLPAGLNLGADTGIIDGTPAAVGSSAFTVQAIDSSTIAAAKTSKPFSIAITKLSQVSISSTAMTPGTVNTPYSQVLQAAGGAAPYAWSVIAGSLPPGLLLSGSGTISGIPSAAAPFGFTAQVVDAAGGTAIAAVSLTVTAAPLTVVPVTLPSAIAGAPYPAQVLSATGGTPPYTFTISQGALPIGLSLTNGSIVGTPGSNATGSFTVKVTDATQASATASQQIVVRSSLPVDLILSAGSVSFSLATGATDVPEPQTFTIASSNINTPISYLVAMNPAVPWLTVTGALNSVVAAPGFVTLSLNTQALALAAANTPYSTSISITCAAPSPCAGNSQTVNVSLAVGTAPPQLTLTTPLLALSVTAAGTVATSVFGIQNSGGGAITVNSVSSPDPWLGVGGAPSILSPGAPSYVSVTGNPAGLTPGRLYRSTITVATSAGFANLPVTMIVSSNQTMSLNPVGQLFQMAAGGAVGNPNGSTQVVLGGGTAASWTAATLPGANWLTVKTPTGTSTPSAPGILSYAIDPAASAALATGAYYGRIRITSGQVVNTPQDLLVVLNVAPAGAGPDPDPQPSGLLFVSSGSATPPSQTLTLYASSSAPVPYLASASTTTNANWLSVTPTSGSSSAGAPGRPIVSVNPAGLGAGVYRGVVTYQFSPSALRSVNVTYIVPALTGGLPFFRSEVSLVPHATCSPLKVVPTATGLPSSFSQAAAWPTALSILLSDDCGNPVANGRVDVTFTNNDPAMALVSDPANPGRYSGTWTPRGALSQVTVTAAASAPGLASARIQITGKVTPNVAPLLTPGGMLNVFNPLLGGGIAPGTAVQIYGSNLALPGVSNLASSLPFPTSLSGTSVLIGGTPAPLYFVSPGQINALAPFELAPGIQYQVLVSVNGAITTPDKFTSAAGAPGIAAFANGSIIAQHLDVTLITDASPAKPGEIIVLYLAGLGSATNQPPTGSGAPNPPTDPLNTVTLTLNGKPAPLLFVGLTPGAVGLYQIDVTVPDDTPEGNQILSVSQAGAVSNTTILPVRK